MRVAVIALLVLAGCRDHAVSVDPDDLTLRVDERGAVLVEGLAEPQRLIEQSFGAEALFSPDRQYVALAHAPLSNLSVCEVFAWNPETTRYEVFSNLSALAWERVATELSVSADEFINPRCLPVAWAGAQQVTLALTGRSPDGDRLVRTLTVPID